MASARPCHHRDTRSDQVNPIYAQPTLVLLPGLDGTGLLSAPLVARLAELGIRTDVLAYPDRGSQDYASLADALRTRLPATPFVLLGESFAGPLAIQLAAEAPPALMGVILSTTFAHRPVLLPAIAAHLMRPAWPIPPPSMLAPLLLGRWATPEWVSSLGEALKNVPAGVLRRRAAATLRVDMRAEVGSIGVPMLGLLANQDRLLWRGSVSTLQRLMPGAHWVALDGPHLLLQARAGEAATVIVAWMQGLGGPTAQPG